VLVVQLSKPQTRKLFTGLICKLRLDKSSDPQADNMGVKALIRRTLACPPPPHARNRKSCAAS
jgi:hypothetical protein